jgi:hypothetical protein
LAEQQEAIQQEITRRMTGDPTAFDKPPNLKMSDAKLGASGSVTPRRMF